MGGLCAPALSSKYHHDETQPCCHIEPRDGPELVDVKLGESNSSPCGNETKITCSEYSDSPVNWHDGA